MAKILNLGPVSASWLQEIGVSTIDNLRIKGSVETYIALKQLQPRASLNLLYSLEAPCWKRPGMTCRKTLKLAFAEI